MSYCECQPESYPFICQRTGLPCGQLAHELCRRSKQAGGLAKSVTRWLVSGMPVAPEDVVEVRRSACHACDEWTGVTCRVCGCTAIKWKLQTEKCPKGYW